jgi:hypothetical protein
MTPVTQQMLISWRNHAAIAFAVVTLGIVGSLLLPWLLVFAQGFVIGGYWFKEYTEHENWGTSGASAWIDRVVDWLAPTVTALLTGWIGGMLV